MREFAGSCVVITAQPRYLLTALPPFDQRITTITVRKNVIHMNSALVAVRMTVLSGRTVNLLEPCNEHENGQSALKPFVNESRPDFASENSKQVME
jgi:hypothetical protein